MSGESTGTDYLNCEQLIGRLKQAINGLLAFSSQDKMGKVFIKICEESRSEGLR